jgi:hypothetical protein
VAKSSPFREPSNMRAFTIGLLSFHFRESQIAEETL